MAIMVKSKIKKWGNSFGVIIPKAIMDSEGFKENENVEFLLIKNNKNIIKETFGMLKKKDKQTTEELMREIDRDLYPEDYE